MSISDIRKRLEISERTDEIFDDGSPNWYGRDIKTLLDLIDRMKGVIIGAVPAAHLEADGRAGEWRKDRDAILKELEEA